MLDEILNRGTKDYEFNKLKLDEIKRNVIKFIKESKEEFEKLYDIDKNHYDCDISVAKICEIINQYEMPEKTVDDEIEKIAVIYNGNLFMTIKLCFESIIKKKQIVLIPSQFMVAVNSFIVQVFKNILSDYSLEYLIDLCNLIDYKELENSNLSKVICLDCPEEYQILEDYNIKNLQEKIVTSIDFYYDDEFVELKDLIFEYVDNYNIYLMSFDDVPKEEVPELFEKYTDGAIVLVLTKDEQFKDKLIKTIKSKKLLINKNPFVMLEKIEEDIF